MSAWITLKFGAVLPRAPGVYAIYADGRLIYIGQSVDVRARLVDHRIRHGYYKDIITPWGDFASVTIKVSLSRRYGDWAMRELRLIRRLRPPVNLRGFGCRMKAAA